MVAVAKIFCDLNNPPSDVGRGTDRKLVRVGFVLAQAVLRFEVHVTRRKSWTQQGAEAWCSSKVGKLLAPRAIADKHRRSR